MLAVDGNNSLKRIDGIGTRQIGDTRVFNNSDYFLSRPFVDEFADEVPSRAQSGTDSVDGNEIDGIEDGNEVDPDTDTVPPCVKDRNWKAAAPDEKKRTWSLFDETGVFVSACRHGLVLWIADMVKSGEL